MVVVWVLLFSLAFGWSDPFDWPGGLVWAVGYAYLAYDTALLAFTGWQLRNIDRPEIDRPEIDRPEMDRPEIDRQGSGAPPTAGVRVAGVTVAVIVASHNELLALPRTLRALLDQTVAPEEIVIADDGSVDGTAEMLCAEYGFECPKIDSDAALVRVRSTRMRWLRLSHRGKSGALNAGILSTSADVIVTVDADTVPDRTAIDALRWAFAAEPELVACTGIITPKCRRTVVGRAMEWFQTYEYVRNFLARYAWMQVGCLQLLSGAFAGFLRTSVIDVGGFDDACFVEDYELVARMRRHAGERGLDWRFRVLGTAQARTEAPGSVPAFLRQRRRWFGGFLQTHWWYRAMVGDSRLGRLGTVMLPVKAIDTVAPLYGLAAVGLLFYFVVTRRFDVLGPILIVLVGKLVVDMAFHIWALRRYRRWVGDTERASLWSAAVVLVVEPLTFTLLLHVGALLGWFAFLGGGQRWGRQKRFGLDPSEGSHRARRRIRPPLG